MSCLPHCSTSGAFRTQWFRSTLPLLPTGTLNCATTAQTPNVLHRLLGRPPLEHPPEFLQVKLDATAGGVEEAQTSADLAVSLTKIIETLKRTCRERELHLSALNIRQRTTNTSLSSASPKHWHSSKAFALLLYSLRPCTHTRLTPPQNSLPNGLRPWNHTRLTPSQNPMLCSLRFRPHPPLEPSSDPLPCSPPGFDPNHS